MSVSHYSPPKRVSVGRRSVDWRPLTKAKTDTGKTRKHRPPGPTSTYNTNKKIQCHQRRVPRRRPMTGSHTSLVSQLLVQRDASLKSVISSVKRVVPWSNSASFVLRLVPRVNWRSSLNLFVLVRVPFCHIMIACAG